VRCYQAQDPKAPPPLVLDVTFTCDGDHGLFPPPKLEFELGDEMAWHTATRRGWVIVPERDLCPECAGRRRA
jgi:hypothetical protein